MAAVLGDLDVFRQDVKMSVDGLVVARQELFRLEIEKNMGGRRRRSLTAIFDGFQSGSKMSFDSLFSTRQGLSRLDIPFFEWRGH